jgi:hypothetical protein
METTLCIRRAAREEAGAGPRVLVDVNDRHPDIPEDGSPIEVGQSYGFETRGGTPIYYPSAYSKTGWSNMVYRHSTIRVIVTTTWVFQHCQECSKCALEILETVLP